MAGTGALRPFPEGGAQAGTMEAETQRSPNAGLAPWGGPLSRKNLQREKGAGGGSERTRVSVRPRPPDVEGLRNSRGGAARITNKTERSSVSPGSVASGKGRAVGRAFRMPGGALRLAVRAGPGPDATSECPCGQAAWSPTAEKARTRPESPRAPCHRIILGGWCFMRWTYADRHPPCEEISCILRSAVAGKALTPV